MSTIILGMKSTTIPFRLYKPSLLSIQSCIFYSSLLRSPHSSLFIHEKVLFLWYIRLRYFVLSRPYPPYSLQRSRPGTPPLHPHQTFPILGSDVVTSVTLYFFPSGTIPQTEIGFRSLFGNNQKSFTRLTPLVNWGHVLRLVPYFPISVSLVNLPTTRWHRWLNYTPHSRTPSLDPKTTYYHGKWLCL